MIWIRAANSISYVLKYTKNLTAKTHNAKCLIDYFNREFVLSVGAVEYTDCISAEG